MMRLVSILMAFSILLPGCAPLHVSEHQRVPAAEGRIPDNRGMLTDVEGIMGGMYRCDSPTALELSQVDKKIAHLKIDGSAVDVAKFGNRMLENYLEELFFQEISWRSHAATTCQLNFLNSYFSDRKISSVLNENGWQIYQSFHSVLNKMIVLRDEKSSFRSSIRMGHDPMDKSMAQANMDLKGAKLGEDVAGLDQGINGIIAQVPLGHHSIVKDALRELSKRTEVSEQDFIDSYSAALSQLKPKIQKAENYFQTNLDKDGFYKVSRGDKIAYMQSGRADALLKEIDPQGTKLACRVKAQYSSGPATTQLVAMLGLLVASVATDGAAAVLVGIGMTATMVADVAHQCFKPTMNVSSEQVQSCEPNQMAITSLSEASMISCGVSVAFLAVPVLSSFAMEIRQGYKSIRAVQRSAVEMAEAEKLALAAREAKAAATVSENEIVVTARRVYKMEEPLPSKSIVNSNPQLNKLSAEIEPCIKSLPESVQKRLRAKFTSQPEEKTIKDLQEIKDLRRINGNCK